jgi:IstB-like ATP binding protein
LIGWAWLDRCHQSATRRVHWHGLIGDPTIADAVLDRLVRNSHRLILEGESLRKADYRFQANRFCQRGNPFEPSLPFELLGNA